MISNAVEPIILDWFQLRRCQMERL